jgi:methylated-DNA-protein-cysteine methyltransferase related protein
MPKQVTPSTWAAQVYAAVSSVPRGHVATYGDVAYAVGAPQKPRQVGTALSALTEAQAQQIPWQRIVNAKGFLSIRGQWMAKDRQRAILRSEGVEVDDKYTVVNFATHRHVFPAPTA